MQTDTQFLELPLKYAFTATLVFVVSAFFLGYFYQFLALSAFDSSVTGSSWEGIKAISGLTLDRTTRYFIFYFLIFISLTCYTKSPAKSSSWSPIILFAVIPSLAGVVPFLLSSGEFQSSSHWSLLAVLIALMLLGISPKNGTKFQRRFFFLLFTIIMVNNLMQDASTWLVEVSKMATQVYGEHAAYRETWASLYYFAPAAVISMAVNFYLIYRLPSNFLIELNKERT